MNKLQLKGGERIERKWGEKLKRMERKTGVRK